jgi:hypothetical protein
MDKDEGSDYKGSTTHTPEVEIEGMQMLSREQSKAKEQSIWAERKVR